MLTLIASLSISQSRAKGLLHLLLVFLTFNCEHYTYIVESAIMSTPIPSPGNLYSPKALPMNIPSLDHLFRLCVEMAPPQAHTIIPSPHGTSSTRIIMPIAGGTISGPTINGTIVPNSGADWAMHLSGTDVSQTMVSAPNTPLLRNRNTGRQPHASGNRSSSLRLLD